MTLKRSLSEGYPYGPAKSLELFPRQERPVGQQIDAAITDGVLMTAEIIQKYSIALHEAEQQIEDIQTVYPFLPEDYGFSEIEEDEEDEEESFKPRNVYESKDKNIILERIHDTTWRVQISGREIPDPVNPAETLFSEADIDLLITIESEQEAYQFFKIMGVLKSIQPTISTVPEGSELIGEPIQVQMNNGAKTVPIEELSGHDEPEEEIKPFTV